MTLISPKPGKLNKETLKEDESPRAKKVTSKDVLTSPTNERLFVDSPFPSGQMPGSAHATQGATGVPHGTSG